ncbi:hypothetical protein FACS189442_2100 [Spirochaetia bacterium]|nr:hypothetical protein FACS189442_2100 [Spirochaetia bacterium]
MEGHSGLVPEKVLIFITAAKAGRARGTQAAETRSMMPYVVHSLNNIAHQDPNQQG